MRSIKLFYSASCEDCTKLAKQTKKLDWFGKVELSTEVPPSGPLNLGNIAVYHYRSNRVYTGVYATRKVCMYVPAYFIYGLILYFPPIRRFVGRGQVGCNGNACNL